MNQFTITGRERMVLFGFMILGAICLAMTYILEPATISATMIDHGTGESVTKDIAIHHTRFWTNLLHNTVLFTGMAFTAMFAYSAFISGYGGWFSGMKRLWEAYALYMGVGLVLFLIIIAGVWFHWHHLYHWNVEGVATKGHENYDKVIAGKSSFLNKYWYSFGTIIFLGSWYLITAKVRALSVAEDSLEAGDYSAHNKIRWWIAFFLPIGAFTSAALIWQWIMSIDAHWYSTMYAWNATASFFVAMLSLTVLMLIYLRSRGFFMNVNENHMHDIGKFLFGFSVFWTYTWFSQYMLIWYSNNGEETVYFLTRRDQYPVLFWSNIVLNFVLPFLILIRNSSKRKFGTIGLVAGITLFGHWLDIFLMIKPGAWQNLFPHGASTDFIGTLPGYTLPGLLEIGIFLGFLASFIYFAFTRLAAAQLVPTSDPYIGESVTHHVI